MEATEIAMPIREETRANRIETSDQNPQRYLARSSKVSTHRCANYTPAIRELAAITRCRRNSDHNSASPNYSNRMITRGRRIVLVESLRAMLGRRSVYIKRGGARRRVTSVSRPRRRPTARAVRATPVSPLFRREKERESVCVCEREERERANIEG